MSKVIRLRHALQLGPDINASVSALDKSIADAVDAAKAAGLPQGLIVSLLHGHAHAQTHQMVTE
jgi:ABC-type sugar transport system substrate-binding protein